MAKHRKTAITPAIHIRIAEKDRAAIARGLNAWRADKASDEPAADLLTQRLAVHEPTAWMLHRLLED